MVDIKNAGLLPTAGSSKFTLLQAERTGSDITAETGVMWQPPSLHTQHSPSQ